jgi:hypothetical protein
MIVSTTETGTRIEAVEPIFLHERESEALAAGANGLKLEQLKAAAATCCFRLPWLIGVVTFHSSYSCMLWPRVVVVFAPRSFGAFFFFRDRGAADNQSASPAIRARALSHDSAGLRFNMARNFFSKAKGAAWLTFAAR